MRALFKITTTLPLLILMSLLTFVSFSTCAEQDKEKANTSKSDQLDKKNIVVPPPISLEQQHKNDLKHYIPANTVTPILAGPHDYLTLIQKNTSANAKGAVILFPGWQQGAVDPKAINFLRHAMTKQGWTTISIQPPNKPQSFPSIAPSKEKQKKENEATLSEYKIKLSALNTALYAKAKEYPGLVIVIAQGNIGAMLVDLYDQGDKPPNGLILLSSHKFNSHILINDSNRHFAEKLAVSKYPILDLYLKYDHPIVISKAPERLALASQKMKVYYRQRQLNNTVAGFYPEQALLSQINGWLKSIR